MNMNTNQKKQQQLNRGIAIAVAILLSLTLIVTIIAFSASKRSGNTSTAASTLKPTGTTSATTSKTNATTSTQGTTSEPDEPTVNLVPDFICPVSGTLVKDYSADIPVFSLTMEDYRVHCGIDIGADAGTDVLAAADGTVSKVYYDPMMGQTIEINHAGGYTSVYKNLQTKIPAGITEGVKVSAGDVIGYVGDTALVEISDSPHLHFEMIKDDDLTNPLSHIKLTESDASKDYEDNLN